MAIDYIGIKKTFDKFRKDYLVYARIIKKKALEFFKERLYSVIIFGSTIEEKAKPLSDIDIAIILMDHANDFERAKFRVLIDKVFGLHPFEIHIITVEEWENWFKRFVKKYTII